MPSRSHPTFSFEFFPPKTDKGAERLRRTVDHLVELRPDFVSVTFGAGGSTREGTFNTVQEIRQRSGLLAVPHISCVGSTRDELRDVLRRYQNAGIERVVALRGDRPQDGSDFVDSGLRYANELVELIRSEFPRFHISVGCYPEFHPECPDPDADLRNFVRKVKAGADEAMTQYFFGNEAYYRFVSDAQALGVDIPIVPGLMPITNFKQIERFSGFCGADIPLWIRKRMEAFEDDLASQEKLGIEIATRQAEDLLRQGVPGIHLYTLNKHKAAEAIWKNLGLPPAEAEARPA